jgi:hypothetical protein
MTPSSSNWADHRQVLTVGITENSPHAHLLQGDDGLCQDVIDITLPAMLEQDSDVDLTTIMRYAHVSPDHEKAAIQRLSYETWHEGGTGVETG